MKEPFTVRLNDKKDPKRGERFEALLVERGANPTNVIRHLVDAYIKSDGDIRFPARVVSLLEPCGRE